MRGNIQTDDASAQGGSLGPIFVFLKRSDHAIRSGMVENLPSI